MKKKIISWRCIGLNPLRARLVSDLEGLDRYPWCSQAVLIGHHSLEGQVVDEVLARLGARRKHAVREYRAVGEAGVTLGWQTELVGGEGCDEASGGHGAAPNGARVCNDNKRKTSGFSVVVSLCKRGGRKVLRGQPRRQRCPWRS